MTARGTSFGLETVRAGFIPLTDCAPLIVAEAMGFARDEGLRLELVRETSWATVRDRIAVRHLDVAHMLSPMPIASNLGLTPLAVPLIAPMALGFGGNTVTVSRPIFEELPGAGLADLAARPAGRALAAHIADRRARALPPLVLAIVHAHSAHYCQLAYWLAASGVDPRRDVDLVVVPPPLIPAALAEGQIDGFCSGEPWGSVAVAAGGGQILTTSAHIWRNSPEKVLGLRRDFAEANPERVSRLVRAVYRAAVWCDEERNRGRLAELLARPEHLGQSAQIIHRGLGGQLPGPGGDITVPGFMTFAATAATFPWTSQAAWFYAQMVRWGQAQHSTAALKQALSSFRPDLARAALAPIGVAMPTVDSKIEGGLAEPTEIPALEGTVTIGPDAFFDGRTFDPHAFAGNPD